MSTEEEFFTVIKDYANVLSPYEIKALTEDALSDLAIDDMFDDREQVQQQINEALAQYDEEVKNLK